MGKFFEKKGFSSENEYEEYVNLYLITALATLLYVAYGVLFALFSCNIFLMTAQTLCILVCMVSFLINRKRRTRAATILMVLLVCVSINIWAFALNVGNDLRWYAVLALCPLFFFSSIKPHEKGWLTALVMLSFLSATSISLYHTPLAVMPNAELFDTISDFLIVVSIAFELIMYKLINTKRDDELNRVGTILENIACGIIILDAETNEIQDVNPVAVRMYGDDKKKLIGKKCTSTVCAHEKCTCVANDNKYVLDRSEQIFVSSDGRHIPIIKSVAKVWYNGRLSLLESFTDITSLKKAEDKLRRMEITEQSNRAKSEFLSRMSHEIRTPMNAIIGMTKIAEGTDDVGRLKYCLSTIEASSAHLLGIINDILDMSKIEAGKLLIDSVPLSVEKLLRKACGLILEQVERKQIELGVYMDKGAVEEFLGDELRLSQIIANLLSNAVKFTPERGAIRVTVAETQRQSDHSVLRFTVTDTGIGMTDEQMDRLFNAFEQADGSITRQYGGTGLGLAISRSIVEKMGGQIWAESELGQGSTFVFEVRLGHADGSDGNNLSDINPSASLRVLVAHSNADTRHYFADIAAWYGIAVREAVDPKDLALCLKQACEARTPYDAVFLAYDWPGTNGIELLQRLSVVVDKDTVVFMTPFLTWNKIEGAAHNVGVTGFVPVPLFPSIVRDAVISATCKTEASPVTRADETGNSNDFSAVTLLLVEDVEINREIFMLLLADTNIQIEVAGNGVEAVEKFVNQPDRYDIIIMDIQMPVMNGYEATRRIRSLNSDWAKEVPIIALSADAFKDDIDRCIACGMNDHLKKPIELELVMEKLTNYCRER